MSCPICQKPTDPAFRPFCSSRCANIDLGRWLNEEYVLPTRDETPENPPETPTPEKPRTG